MHDGEWLRSERRAAAAWAAALLDSGCVILDGETTGTGPRDEFVQLAAVDQSGEVLLNSLIQPTQRIDPGAARVHGLTAAHLVDAPGFPQIYPRLAALLSGRSVVIYNAAFDRRILDQACARYGLPRLRADWHCAMLRYAQFHGEWNYQYESFRWHKLAVACRSEGIAVSGAHAALTDCFLTLRLLETMAAWLDAAPDP